MTVPTQIRNSAGERLDHSFHAGAGDGRELVVIGHGVTGNKDRPFAVALAEGLSSAGIAALRFSFSGNGESEGDFRASTISKEVDDLGAVLETLAGWRLAYAGHSMAAAVGVLRAVRDARISALISLGGMVHTRDFAQRKFGELTPDRDCMWDIPECPLSATYMQDMAAIDSVLPLAKRVQVPWLLVHGTADEVVPCSESEQIFAEASEPKRLELIDGANHVFTDGSAPQMVALVVDWVREQWNL